MTDMFDDVGKFHVKFGLPYAGESNIQITRTIEPRLLTKGDFKFRANFLQEELEEFYDAHDAGNLPDAADALIDLVYVALGTLHLMRVPGNAVWDAVQAANMAKVRATGSDDLRSTRKHALDVVKPEGWQPPDVAGILKDAGWEP